MTPEGQVQAHCVLHPEVAAEGTCARCGNFLCFTCNEAGRYTQCPTCRAQRAFPLRRESWTFDALWNLVWTRFQQEWVMLSVASLIIFGTSMVVGSVSQAFQMAAAAAFKDDAKVMGIVVGVLMVITQLISIFIQGVMQLGMYRICTDVLRGTTVDLGHFLRQGRKLGSYALMLIVIMVIAVLPVMIVAGALGAVGYYLFGGANADPDPAKIALLIAGPVLLLAVPYVWLTVPLTMAMPELAILDNIGAVRAVRNAYSVAKGDRLRIMGVLFAGVAVAMVGLVACCIGIIPATALTHLLTTGLYLSLRSGQADGAVPAVWSTEEATSST